MATNKKNNFGLFAAVFAAIFGTTYGLFSLGKKIQGRNAMMEQIIGEAQKLFQQGMTEEEIFKKFCADAAKQTGKSVNNAEIKSKVNEIVLEAKRRFEANGSVDLTANSSSSGADLDESLQDIFLAIKNALQRTEPFLKFDDLYAAVKKAEEIKDTSDLQVFIQNQEYDTTTVWKVWMDAEQKLNRATYYFDSSESTIMQRKREEVTNLNSLPNAFKNLLVTRGRVLRHVKNMYNGKNKREETKQHEAQEFKVLVKLYQNDINRVTTEMDAFNAIMDKNIA